MDIALPAAALFVCTQLVPAHQFRISNIVQNKLTREQKTTTRVQNKPE